MGFSAHSHSSLPTSSGAQPKSAPTRFRLPTTPMATRSSPKPFNLLNSIAGPLTLVGRCTVPPAPTCRYTPANSAIASTSTSVSSSCPGMPRSTSSAVRKSSISSLAFISATSL